MTWLKLSCSAAIRINGANGILQFHWQIPVKWNFGLISIPEEQISPEFSVWQLLSNASSTLPSLYMYAWYQISWPMALYTILTASAPGWTFCTIRPWGRCGITHTNINCINDHWQIYWFWIVWRRLGGWRRCYEITWRSLPTDIQVYILTVNRCVFDHPHVLIIVTVNVKFHRNFFHSF